MRRRLMGLLPYEELRVETKLNAGDVKVMLSSVLEPPKGSGDASAHQPFRGAVEGDAFRIRRVIGYRNWFLPVVEGAIKPESEGSVVEVKMVLSRPAFMLTVVWLGFSFSTLMLAVVSMAGKGAYNLSFIPPLTLFILGYGICMVGFKAEAANAKTCLKGLLGA